MFSYVFLLYILFSASGAFSFLGGGGRYAPQHAVSAETKKTNLKLSIQGFSLSFSLELIISTFGTTSKRKLNLDSEKYCSVIAAIWKSLPGDGGRTLNHKAFRLGGGREDSDAERAA